MTLPTPFGDIQSARWTFVLCVTATGRRRSRSGILRRDGTPRRQGRQGSWAGARSDLLLQLDVQRSCAVGVAVAGTVSAPLSSNCCPRTACWNPKPSVMSKFEQLAVALRRSDKRQAVGAGYDYFRFSSATGTYQETGGEVPAGLLTHDHVPRPERQAAGRTIWSKRQD